MNPVEQTIHHSFAIGLFVRWLSCLFNLGRASWLAKELAADQLGKQPSSIRPAGASARL